MLNSTTTSWLVGVTGTVLVTLSGFFLYEPMLVFIYPSIGVMSLNQFFYSQIYTTLGFFFLGVTISLCALSNCRLKQADRNKAFFAPILTAFFAITLGLVYYKYKFGAITSGDVSPSPSVLIMADAIKLYYIPLFASGITAILAAYMRIKSKRDRHAIR